MNIKEQLLNWENQNNWPEKKQFNNWKIKEQSGNDKPI